jgi:sensor c-di-GMP phosphodiesterase-like protein
MSIVCEGVETSKQKELILANGGIVVQGFYYSKPLSISDFIEKYLK